MAAAWYRARGDLRRRSRALLLLVVLVGLAGGAVLTAVAGARRSSTAYDRLRDVTLAADLDVAFDGPPGDDLEAAIQQVRELPQVAALAWADYPFIVPEGSGFYPYLDFLAYARGGDADDPEVDRPRVVRGTPPDPDAADEIAITETYARESGLDVGDRAAFEAFAPAQLEPLFTTGDAGPPAGPSFTLRVTAVFDAPTFLSESSGDFQPRVFLTRAFLSDHRDDVATYPGGLALRLHGGAADVDEVTATLRGMFADSTTLEITPASEVDRKIRSGIDVIVVALVLCALVAGLAGCLAVAQALVRHFASTEPNDRGLAVLGMTRGERIAAKVATAIPVALLGALAAVALSILASPLMPVGIARRAEPEPGLSVDAAVVLGGFVAIAIVVLLLSVLAAAVVDRRAGLAVDRRAGAEPSRAMRALRRTRLEPPGTIGVAMALEPRDGTSWAVQSALVAVTIAVLGLTAVVVFGASVDELGATPERYGSPFDASVSGFSGDVLADGAEELLADRRVAKAGLALSGLARVGGEEVNSHVLESLKGDLHLAILDGRRPLRAGEVVLGRATLDRAGARLGDQVELDGAIDSVRATVVGVAAFPVFDERGSPGRGVLLGRDDFERISSPDEINNDVLIEWADGVDAGDANADLAAATETEVFAPRLPSDVNNLLDVRSLPRALAAFLAMLGGLALAHALVSTVRMRRRDLAVLRGLGFERRQLRRTLLWQATTIGTVGVVAGVPLGLILGRAAWRAVARGIGVVDDPVVPAIAIGVVVVGVLVVLAATAVLPSRSAGRVSSATVLRSG